MTPHTRVVKEILWQRHRMTLKAKTDFLDKGLIPPKTLRSSSNLDLFMDDHFLLRCKGHLQNVSFPWDTIHPILLPKNSSATRSYI